ncbi:glutathione S-transferase family protein [Vibrio sinaloensis]|uniref:glutathione S-transferase family protein n=1 Tax=Photobacterium sp. (strain ATCC 43367) TaxID=379097 RepID=UPI00057FFE1E|nr:glutathione S-transferase family protein [Vibrio sinaloensis]KHT51885.1 hypothetical protein RJ46_03975 [Vibrio sinaloensis]
MKLYLNDTSPFSRAVLATAVLTNMPLTLEWVDPWATPDTLLRLNPFSTIPVLETEGSHAILESLTICEYLLQHSSSAQLQPVKATNTPRIVLLGQSKTLMEVAFRSAALARFDAENNPLSIRGKQSIQRAIHSLVSRLEAEPTLFEPDFASLYLHVALDYVLFRHSELLEPKTVDSVKTALSNSPYQSTLNRISIEVLSKRPLYNEL